MPHRMSLFVVIAAFLGVAPPVVAQRSAPSGLSTAQTPPAFSSCTRALQSACRGVRANAPLVAASASRPWPLIGAVVGGLSGLVFGTYIGREQCSADVCSRTGPPHADLVFGGVGVGVGVGVGLLTGFVVPRLLRGARAPARLYGAAT